LKSGAVAIFTNYLNKEKKNGYFTGDFTGPSSGSGF
jgi:hypothetical protein